MKKKILVTGGAGFIGGNFIHYMVNKYTEYMIVNLNICLHRLLDLSYLNIMMI